MAEPMPSTSAPGLRAASWSVPLLGLVVLLIPFLTESTGERLWNDVLVGAGVIVAGTYAAWALTQERLGRVAAITGLLAALGLWLMTFPLFVLPAQPYFWANVVTGIVLFFVAGYVAWSTSPAGRKPMYDPIAGT